MEYGIKRYHHDIWQQLDLDGNMRWHVRNHDRDLETCHEDAATAIRLIEVAISLAKSFELSDRQDAEVLRLEALDA